MTLAIAGEKIPFYGFVQTAADDKFTKGAKTATGKVVGIAPVTPAFKAAAEKKPDAGGDGGENKPTEEDSASQMTAAIVAVSALAALF